jgi:lipoprotein signal peptidase
MKLINSFFFLLFFWVDQYSKRFFCDENIFGGASSECVCNQNISWNIPLSGFLFWFFWFLALGGLIWLWRKLQSAKIKRGIQLFFLAALAGALSNILDRLTLGCVRDFIQIGFWPLFNFADICVVLGTSGLLVKYVKM